MAALKYDDWRCRQKAFICSLMENNAVKNIRAQNYQSIRDEILKILHRKCPIIDKKIESE